MAANGALKVPSLWRRARLHGGLEHLGRYARERVDAPCRLVAHFQQRRGLPGLEQRGGERLAPAAQEHAQPRLERGGGDGAGAQVGRDELQRLGLPLQLELQRLAHPLRVDDQLVVGLAAFLDAREVHEERGGAEQQRPDDHGHPPAHPPPQARGRGVRGGAGAGFGRAAVDTRLSSRPGRPV